MKPNTIAITPGNLHKIKVGDQLYDTVYGKIRTVKKVKGEFFTLGTIVEHESDIFKNYRIVVK